MSFILSTQREADVVRAFARYRDYLQSVRHAMPESVFALAASDWYFSPMKPGCPHDARLETVTISESQSDEEEGRTVSVRIRLLSAYHDGFIEFYYPRVVRYQLGASDSTDGHQDWRYDEFRLSESGRVIHEIEWCGANDTARWIIEASDVQFQWQPKN